MATQALVKGHPDNARDLIVERVPDPAALATLMVEYRPLMGSTLGELTANFDIVLGTTAQELEDGRIGGIGEPLPR
jgi:protocatechuate 3,4-dioxygenase beta subunit